MTGVIFRETLRRNWKMATYWAIGIASMAVYAIVVIPDSNTLKQYADLLNTMPSFIMNMMGGADAKFAASPEGFLAISFFGWIMLVMAMYGVIAGLSVSIFEEDRGIMDMLLSTPVKRWTVIVEKLLAFTLLILGIVVVTFLTLWFMTSRSPLFTISVGRMLEGCVNMIPGTFVVMTFTALMGVVVRRRNTATAIAAIFVTVSYFVDVIGRTAQVTNALRYFSFYSYYDSTGVLQNGLVPANVIGLLVVSLALFAGSLWFWQRRDVGV